MIIEPTYIQQAQHLVPPEAVTVSARTVLTAHSSAVFEQLRGDPVRLYGVDSGFFYLPLAMALFFGDDQPESLLELATTIAVGHGHFAIMDQVLDARTVSLPLIPAAQIMLSCYLSRMDRSYGAVFDVRAAHDASYLPYAEAALTEHSQRGTLRSQLDADLSQLGAKSAPACMPLRAILTRAGEEDRCDAVESAFLSFADALQLLDDLADLRPDFTDQLSSIPLNLLLFHAMDLRVWPERGEITSADLHALASLSGVDRSCLTIASGILVEAEEKARVAGALPLQQAARARLAATRVKLDRCREAALLLR